MFIIIIIIIIISSSSSSISSIIISNMIICIVMCIIIMMIINIDIYIYIYIYCCWSDTCPWAALRGRARARARLRGLRSTLCATSSSDELQQHARESRATTNSQPTATRAARGVARKPPERYGLASRAWLYYYY